MPTYNSAEIAAQVAIPPTPLDPTQDKGRVRVAHFDLQGVSAIIADNILLAKLPAGKVRVLRYCLKHTSWTAACTLSAGNLAYTRSSDKATVAASSTSVAAAIAMNNTTDIDVLVDQVFDSTTGVTLQGVVAGAVTGAIPAGNAGWVEYVQD